MSGVRMDEVFYYVKNHPGCSLHECATRIARHEGHGYRAVHRAIESRMIARTDQGLYASMYALEVEVSPNVWAISKTSLTCEQARAAQDTLAPKSTRIVCRAP